MLKLTFLDVEWGALLVIEVSVLSQSMGRQLVTNEHDSTITLF